MTIRLLFLVVLLGMAALALSACGNGDGNGAGAGDGDSGEISAEARAEAAELFRTRCTTCHGESGKGDGPTSVALDPSPRDLTSAEWQQSVTDEHIETIIASGGAAVGRSPAMPGNPDLDSEVVRALREYIRKLPSSGGGE